MNIIPDMKPNLKQLVYRLLFAKRFLKNTNNPINKELLVKRIKKSESDIINECIRLYEKDFINDFGDR